MNHRRGVLVLGVQFRPPLGVGDGLFLLSMEILVSVGHPHIPLGLVLALLPDGLQHLNGAPQGLFCLVVGRLLLMVAQNCIVLQRPGHGVGGAVVSPVFRDGIQCLDAAGVLVLVVPLLQLLEEFFFVLRGVRDIVHARQRLVQLRGLLLLGRRFQVHSACFPAEGMESGPGDVAVLEEFLGHLERRLDVPGNEVHIAAEKAGGSAGEGEYLRSVAGGEHFLQLVPEVKNLLSSFLLPQGIQGIAEEAGHRSVGMEIVHKVIVGIQIAVDEGHTVGGTGHHIQPPVGFRVFIGFHFVAKVAVQIGIWIGGEVRSLFLQHIGQLGQEEGLLRLGLLQYIEVINVPHVGDLAQHLVSKGGEHPPDSAFCLLKHRQQLFAVGREGEAVFALLLQPDLHIIPRDIPSILGTQADVLEGLTAHQDVPVLQHLLGGVLLEVNQLKQLDLVTLRGEDQLMLFAIEAHLEGDFIKDQIQDFLHLGHEFCAAGMVFVLVHHLAQFCFHLGKGFPPVLCPFPEALRELRQRNALLAPVDQLHGVLVVGAGLQCLFKVTKSPALLIQIVIGIAHAKVPVVVSLKVFLMRFQESDGLFEHSSAFRRSVICLIVVRPCKLAVHFRSALLNALQCFNDLLVFVLLMPLLALL